MPGIPFDPESVVIVGAVAGVFAGLTYILYKYADQQGAELNLMPKPPPFFLIKEMRLPTLPTLPARV